nr:hypothetical protein GCM10020093_088210 [Planobispora longispora]
MGRPPPDGRAGVRGQPHRPGRLAPPGRPFTFVTDGVESAVTQAKEVAGDGWIGVGSKIASQCLNAGLLDEIRVDLVPVLLGGGVPFFEGLTCAPVELEGPRVIEGTGVTHLYYTVKSGETK